MKKYDIKNDLLERIQQIDDMNTLNAIQVILNTLENEHFEFDQIDNNMETEDFSGYIKEWLKSM